MKAMKKITLYFKSRSGDGVKYKTERHRTGRITCFCPGAVYAHKCWHMERIAELSKARKEKTFYSTGVNTRRV